MDQNLTRLEEEIASLQPVGLPDDLLAKLDDAMVAAAEDVAQPSDDVIVATSDPELAKLEESLKGLTPLGMPEDLISRLDAAMQRWHEEVPFEEKVVPMRPEESSEKNWIGFRSVAAVGILGAATALIWSGRPQQNNVVESPRIPVLTDGAVSRASFVSKDAKASVVLANDHGVIWTKSGQPVRCLEVEVNNSLKFENEHGDKLILEKPRREVRFFPAKLD